MKNRILRIIEEQGLTNSQFADKVGIPRSGLSHVLSGRNKPSLDYVMKIMEAFPDIDPDWLLKGKKREQAASVISSGIENLNKKVGEQAGKMAQAALGDNGEKEPQKIQSEKIIPASKAGEFDENKIERIVVFYANGRFKEYLP